MPEKGIESFMEGKFGSMSFAPASNGGGWGLDL